MKKKKKILQEITVPASGYSNWGEGAYTLAFLYSPKGNYLIKGYFGEVKEYIKKHFSRYFVNYTLWSRSFSGKKTHRSIWRFWRPEISIRTPSFENNYKWRVISYSSDVGKTNLTFKRLPKKWISEFNNI